MELYVVCVFVQTWKTEKTWFANLLFLGPKQQFRQQKHRILAIPLSVCRSHFVCHRHHISLSSSIIHVKKRWLKIEIDFFSLLKIKKSFRNHSKNELWAENRKREPFYNRKTYVCANLEIIFEWKKNQTKKRCSLNIIWPHWLTHERLHTFEGKWKEEKIIFFFQTENN